jgi:FkbM family methyltransferase
MNDSEAYWKMPITCYGGFSEVWSQYTLPAKFAGGPTVLDIGANAGAFAIFAAIELKAKHVTCYEPNPEMREFLMWNLERLPCVTSLNICAVGNPDMKQLYRHRGCPLLFSQYAEMCDSKTTVGDPIEVKHPSELKPADLVKIDAEGAEGYICENLMFIPGMMLVEYHSDDLRRRVDAATSRGMTLRESRVTKPHEGILKYVKKI